MIYFLGVIFLVSHASGKIIDLSWSLNNASIYPQGFRTFSLTKYISGITEKGFWLAANEYCANEHGGTHFDAPYHFNGNGWRVDQVPTNRLFPRGASINLAEEYERLGRNCSLTVKHLTDWEARNGKFRNGTVLLVNFGLSKFWPEPKKYLDLDEDNVTRHHPGISKEAARWIVDNGNFYGVGLDTPSVDYGNSTEYWTHRILSAASMYHLENVNFKEGLPETDFSLIVAPMKIQDGTGGPVRIFAVLEEKPPQT